MTALFKDRSRCKQNDITQCISFKRIQITLDKFNTTFDEIRDIFTVTNYTNTQLLNDFHHVSYDHHLEDNHEQFATIHKYLKKSMNMKCVATTCQHIDRHYRDRSKLKNEYIINDDRKLKYQYTIELISKIHVYFMHSYDITNRLTLKEISTIEKQLKML
eukprot:367565_1